VILIIIINWAKVTLLIGVSSRTKYRRKKKGVVFLGYWPGRRPAVHKDKVFREKLALLSDECYSSLFANVVSPIACPL
jgi:hypothetical protein